MHAKNPDKGAEGYSKSRLNALRHGILSQHTVLPGEDRTEYLALLNALVAEHCPEGPTEEHLVEEIAGVIWRKRRLRIAEGAAVRRDLTKIGAPDPQTIAAALIDVDLERQSALKAGKIAAIAANQAILHRATAILRSGKTHGYSNAIASLGSRTQELWANSTKPHRAELLSLDTPARYRADAEGLLEFLEDEKRSLAHQQNALEQSELITNQSFGEALKPTTFDIVVRYETFLDRKLERTLAMLLRLKELRHGVIST